MQGVDERVGEVNRKGMKSRLFWKYEVVADQPDLLISGNYMASFGNAKINGQRSVDQRIERDYYFKGRRK